MISYRKVSIAIIWWSYEGIKVPNSSLIEENELYYVIRNRSGYTDKILIKVVNQNKDYAIIKNYSSEELKEMGMSVDEIQNRKTISVYDEIIVNK